MADKDSFIQLSPRREYKTQRNVKIEAIAKKLTHKGKSTLTA